MSVDVPKTTEETSPIVTNDTVPAPDVSETKMAAMTTTPATETPAAAPQPTEVSNEATAIPELKKDEAVVEAVPASEGVLGYKAPGLIKQFRFSKHYFWFSDEAMKSEALATYVRQEKPEVAHHNAAWAQESGKGVFFYSKRAEDKASPAGLIMLAEVEKVTKAGDNEFMFKTGNHTHRFEAPTTQERDSWVVALTTKSEEAKGMKENVTSSEGFKKTFEGYKASPVFIAPAAATASKSEPKKSLDAAAATGPGAGTMGVIVDQENKKETPKTDKSRSQSRKRTSIFGNLLGKKEDFEEKKDLKKEEKAEEKAEKKEVKKEEKAEHKAEKKEVKEEKKVEAAQKKEEAKADKDASKATEAAEAAAVAAVPTAAIVAEKKHEKKEEEKSGATTPTDKKAKRASVFGGLFGKKNLTSPEAEKTESEAGPAVPAKDTDIPPVSETAPKIEKPVEQKPIDTAAVTAPVDTVATPAAVEETPKEMSSTPADTTTTPKTEKKGGFMGFIKKQEAKFEGKKEQKEEVKAENAAEKAAADPVTAAAVEPSTETPAAASDERPVREKRRTSLFGIGAQKKKTEGSSEADAISPAETKREKSPLPTKLGGLFRKPSKAVKTNEEKPTTNGTSESEAIPEATGTPKPTEPTATAPETSESAIVGDVVPEELHTTVHDAVTSEVKAAA